MTSEHASRAPVASAPLSSRLAATWSRPSPLPLPRYAESRLRTQLAHHSDAGAPPIEEDAGFCIELKAVVGPLPNARSLGTSTSGDRACCVDASSGLNARAEVSEKGLELRLA